MAGGARAATNSTVSADGFATRYEPLDGLMQSHHDGSANLIGQSV